jgi:transposase-like protein
MGRGVDLGKEQFWRGLLLRWQASKLSVRAFCDEHEVSEQSFYAWRRTIAERDRQAGATGRRINPVDNLPTFVALTVASPLPSPMLEVVSASGRVIRVPPAFDAATLRRLLTLVEEATPC